MWEQRTEKGKAESREVGTGWVGEKERGEWEKGGGGRGRRGGRR